MVHTVQVHHGQQHEHGYDLGLGEPGELADLDAYEQPQQVYNGYLCLPLGGDVSDIVVIARKGFISA